MLQIKNLNLTHKKDLRVILSEFNLVLNKGDKAVIIGEEGNGKSTLMKWIYNPLLIDNYIENMPMSYIVSDNSGGGKALCEYALEHGHKKIGFFCRGRVNETISIRDRYMGYAAALEEKGLGVNLDYVYANIDDKYEMLTEEERQQYGNVENYLKTIVNRMHEQGISCVLCQNDWVAIQVYNCCKALDISVPNEMCIMGFDNISELDEMDGGNKIITVEQNFFELGVKAGETVLREINGEMPGIKYIVPVKIAVRN